MDYALKLNQFEALSYEEMQVIDGGDVWSDLSKLAGSFCTAWEWTCAFAWMGPFAFVVGFGAGLVDLIWG